MNKGNTMKQAIEEIVVGFAMGAFLGVGIMLSIPDANASPGYDPSGDGDVVCRLMDEATTIDDVDDVVAVYGAQDVTDYVYRGCARNGLKIIASLTRASQRDMI